MRAAQIRLSRRFASTNSGLHRSAGDDLGGDGYDQLWERTHSSSWFASSSRPRARRSAARLLADSRVAGWSSPSTRRRRVRVSWWSWRACLYAARRHVRHGAPAARPHRTGLAVQCLGISVLHAAARAGDLGVRVAGQQGRCQRQRPAAGLGRRPEYRGDRAVPGVDRQPAPVPAHRQRGIPNPTGGDVTQRPISTRRPGRSFPHRGRGCAQRGARRTAGRLWGDRGAPPSRCCPSAPRRPQPASAWPGGPVPRGGPDRPWCSWRCAWRSWKSRW
jgi:hypothetical protein